METANFEIPLVLIHLTGWMMFLFPENYAAFETWLSRVWDTGYAEPLPLATKVWIYRICGPLLVGFSVTVWWACHR